MPEIGLQSEHFGSTRVITALSWAAFFTGPGISMVDTRSGFGVVLCFVGAVSTMIIYKIDIFSMKRSDYRKWPLFGLSLIFIQIAAPIYLLTSKANAEGILPSREIKPDSTEGGKSARESSGTPNQEDSCPPGTDVCLRTSTGGRINGVHIDGFTSCAGRNHLSAKADTAGSIDNVDSKNRIMIDCSPK